MQGRCGRVDSVVWGDVGGRVVAEVLDLIEGYPLTGRLLFW
jgi:hypothetical protein